MPLSLPGIRLFYDPRGHHAGAVSELHWGLKEQGVPYQTITYNGGNNAAALGTLTVRNSPLRVGIGSSAPGEIVLTHAQLSVDASLITGRVTDNDDHLRTFGTNAGQLIKVLPLSERSWMCCTHTRTRDRDTTTLYDSSHIKRDHIRVEVYGAVDGLISQLGVCCATTRDVGLRESLRHIQQALFMLGAELASDARGLTRPGQTIDEEGITALERSIGRNMAEGGPLKQFAAPGKSLASVQLHVAYTQSRRLERLLVTTDRVHPLHDALGRYNNRLSDALFSMARTEETRPGACA